MSETRTQAETMAARYGGDGRQWQDADGIELEDALRAAGADETASDTDDHITRYELPDGSAIVVFGEAWDIGFSSPAICTCCVGVGHDDCVITVEDVGTA